MRGAKILLESLKQEGVDAIFGISGGQVIDIFDAFYDEKDIKYYLTCHEQAAAHAADGYARATGKVGVCLVTSGPGATNAVTGIATANMDSIPLVVFTGQVPTGLIGNDAFQECDITGITRPCTKHNFLVRNIEELASTIKEAFHIARSGRPGPVLVDLPKNVMAAQTDYNPANVKFRNHEVVYKPAPKKMANLFDMLKTAKKPWIMTGGGVILGKAADELTHLARKYEIPVTGTLMGLGSFPGSDPLWLGMLGMHGTYYANMAISHCDFLLAIDDLRMTRAEDYDLAADRFKRGQPARFLVRRQGAALGLQVKPGGEFPWGEMLMVSATICGYLAIALLAFFQPGAISRPFWRRPSYGRMACAPLFPRRDDPVGADLCVCPHAWCVSLDARYQT